ncbi:FecR family protein [Roseicyclus persicicus]|uniref:FecR domain-containing protein n=1 Tax=Roseicyclus persicicus TaxID=2650661 RepID=A0A7X6H1R2_9RHOB|nr:FecR family protein [Roseibacterium persicicum]NKX46340.1 FecR domain-containing protein [Roseibacterium persicicum]
MPRLLPLLCLTALLAAPAAAQQIGTVASSEPTLRGTPPGAATRTLAIGTGLVQDETVASSASGRGQLLFLDQSTLTLAPNTTIVLDRFVFDPATGAGEMGLRLTEGALRFIGGTLSRGQEATITTPTASIGIRGSTTLVLHRGSETYAIFIAGDRLCITVGGTRSCTSRQGGVLGPGGYMGSVSGAFLADLLRLLDGLPPLGPGSGPGTGIGGPNPSDRGPVSPEGEEFDPALFDDDAFVNFLMEVLGGGSGGEGG